MFQLYGYLPNQYISFEKSDNNYLNKLSKHESYDELLKNDYEKIGWVTNYRMRLLVGEEILANAIIRTMWEKVEGAKLRSTLYPLAWIDQDGKLLEERIFDVSSEKSLLPEEYSLLVEIVPAAQDIKYVRLSFDVRKYNKWMSHESDSFPYFILSPMLMNQRIQMENKYDCVSADWKPLFLYNIKYKLYEEFYTTKIEDAYPLSVKLIGTPFALAIDILTSPIQIILFISMDFRQ